MKDICGIKELDQFIVESVSNDMIMLLYFGATWCGPCKQLKDRLKNPETINMMPLLVVGHLDIDHTDNEELCKRYKINSLPTQIFVKLNNNKVTEISRIEGYDFTKFKMEYDKCLNC
jgi:thiol-disulfide isomerase/thioredoxin